MNISRLSIALLSTAVMSLTVACSTTKAPEVDEGPVDWTDRACESPAFNNIQGVYVGEIRTPHSEGAVCVWDTRVSIYGISMGADCALGGNIEANLIDESQPLASDCVNINEKAKFVVGLANQDLNTFGASSVIVHYNDYTGATGGRMDPIALYESLTAEGSTVVTDAGDILQRQ